MLTIFIRHNWKKFDKKDPNHKEIVPKLLNGKKILIGIHCQTKELTKKDAKIAANYPENTQKTMEKFIEISKKGAIVLASYSSLKVNKMFLGKVKPQGIGLFEYIPCGKKKSKNGKAYWIKTLKMDKPRESTAPILSVIIPPHKIIFDLTPKEHIQKRDIIKCAYEQKRLPQKVGSLITAQQEVLCYEYMRKKRLIENLLLPIGRSLEDIDIYGIDRNGKKVIAQVTFSDEKKKNELQKKVDALKKFKKFEKYLFTMDEHHNSDEKIRHFYLKKVFEHV